MDFLSDEAKEYQGMRPGLDIAVIGAAGRFPGARDLHEFWDNLKNGVESIAFFSDTELLESGVSPEELKMANYVRAKGFLEDIEYFDASFFGYSPGEAEKMDPQMRILHECAWHALEGAGYDPYGYGGAIGLYVGAQNNFHWQARVFLAGSGNAVEAFNSLNLVDKDHISTRVAYKLNLTGPTFTLVTQCSTSLVALHQACQGLMSRECDIALAGGVCITLPRKAGYSYQEGMIYSPDGHLRAFAARGNGTVFGNGVGIVVLKPIEDALADGDDVMAVIKSSFVNNDGNRKVGYAAPSVEGQAEALRWALELAGVEPESISYLETHGTATPIGDAIEIDALKLAFDTGKGHCCRIGTVKTNIGHLENAAGAAGLIKTILALKHRLIPPSLHFEAPNPGIDFGQGPFVVNAELTEWKRDGYPLRAGVSSFGIGGTNAHVVLEEAPVSGPSPVVSGENKKQREYRLILLSAHSETALEKMSEKLAGALTKNPGLDLADVAYTLQVGRRVFKYKQALVCRSRQEAVGALRGQEVSPGPMPATGSAPRVHVQTFFNNHDNRSLYFMFPGLGSQYVDMGRELYEAEPVFRREVDRCAAILEPLLDYDIKEILYPGDPVSKGVRKSDNSDKSAIHRIDVAQVVVFVFEYALARLVMAWGIRPHALIGYSFGEYVAACLSGFFSLEDALGVVVYRGQLLREIPGGAMSSVPLTAAELTPLLPPDLYIAVDNGPSCIVSGLKETVEAFEEELKKKKYLCMRLAGEQAIHSPLMEPILEKFTARLRQIPRHEPQIPIISNVTGQPFTADDALDPAYWSRHLRSTVKFADGISQLVGEPGAIWVEIGPGRDLSALLPRYFREDADQHVVNLVRHPGKNVPDLFYLLNKLGSLWLYCPNIDWTQFYDGEKRRRVPLPLYPFERESYWPGDDLFKREDRWAAEKSTAVKREDIADWFYLCQWERSQLSAVPVKETREPQKEEKACWLVLANPLNFCRQLVESLRQAGKELILVEQGEDFSQTQPLSFTLDPRQPAHYVSLLEALRQADRVPHHIVHLWGIGDDKEAGLERAASDEAQVHGLYSLLYLVQAINSSDFTGSFTINLVFNQVFEILGDEPLSPGKATVVGLAKTVQQEITNIKCRCIDIPLPGPSALRVSEEGKLVEKLLQEFSLGAPDTVIGYRGNYRWVETYKPVRFEAIDGDLPRLRTKGVYLITGGLGNIGFILATFLAGTYQARLILTGRTVIPPRRQWEACLASPAEKGPVKKRIRKLLELETLGGEVMASSADVADETQMQEVIDRAEARWGCINGIIHAAGLVGDDTFKPLDSLGKDEFQRQFHPKVYGLLVLAKLFRDRELDFGLLISSPASILGGLGFACYAAANIFVDAFVYRFNRECRTPWLTVNWADWELEEIKKPDDLVRGYVGEMLMSPAEGVETFRRMLAYYSFNQVVVSAGNFQDRLDQWVKLLALQKDSKTAKKSSASLKPRPNLMEPYVPPGSPLEEVLVETWRELFGFEKIGVHDNFFELGGDSLKSLQVSARLLERGYKVNLKDIFDSQDIAALACLIKCNDGLPEPEPASITGDVPLTLSPDQLDRLHAQYDFEDFYPLTPMQEGMFFHALYDPSSPLYIEQKCFRLQGELDIAYVRQSIGELCRRYDILRTAFVLDGFDRPLQVVLKDRDADFYYEDLGGTGSPEDNKREIEEFKEKERNRLFNLGQDVLARVTVLRSGDKTYEFIWTYHHILMDGWCIGKVAADFFEIYTGLKTGRVVPLPKIKPYRTYIRWLENQDKEASKEYWRKYLGNYRGPVGVIGTSPGGVMSGGNKRGRFFFRLDAEKHRLLHKLGERNRVTLNTIIHTLWGIILGKYNHKQDVVFGAVVSGRPPEIRDVETMIGLFINTVPVRIRFTGETSFKELLGRVQQEAAQGQAHHHYPLAELQSQSPIKQQLFDNFVTFDQIVFDEAQLMADEKNREGVPLKILAQESFGHSSYNFNLIINVREQLDMEIKYNAGVIEPPMVERMASYIREISDIVLENDTVKIANIKLSHGLSPASGKSLPEDNGDFRL